MGPPFLSAAALGAEAALGAAASGAFFFFTFLSSAAAAVSAGAGISAGAGSRLGSRRLRFCGFGRCLVSVGPSGLLRSSVAEVSAASAAASVVSAVSAVSSGPVGSFSGGLGCLSFSLVLGALSIGLGSLLDDSLVIYLVGDKYRVGEEVEDKFKGFNRVVVGGDRIINAVGIAVCVDYGDYRDIQFHRLADGYVVMAHIGDNEDAGNVSHIFDAVQVSVQLNAVSLKSGKLFLLESGGLGGGEDGVNFVHLGYALADCDVVCQRAAEPSFGDIMHSGFVGCFLDDQLRLSFRSDKKNSLSFDNFPLEEVARVVELADRLCQVDDRDAVLRAVDEIFSSWGSSVLSDARSEIPLPSNL